MNRNFKRFAMDPIPITSDPAPAQVLLTEKQAASRLHIAPTTLKAWRATGRVVQPPHRKIGGAVRYAQDDIERFIAQSVQPD